jgi:hypothetical protein
MSYVETLKPADRSILTWHPPESDEPASQTGARGILLCTLLFVLSLLITAIGVVAHAQAARLVGGLGVVIFGIGAAPFALIPETDLAARLTAASLVGLSVLLGVGALMADIRVLWHPVLAAVLFLVVAGFLHVLGLSRALKSGPPGWASVSSGIRSTKLTLTKYPIPILATVLGTALWLVSALSLHDPNPGVGGFLTKISPAWYVGNVLIVLGLVTPAVLSLAISTTLTPALVYGAPNEPSAAKHIHLVQIILTHHHLDPSAGIYQAYSAFFAGAAWLCRIVAVQNPFGLATYWPVLVGVVSVIELRLLMGRIVHGTGRRWIAVTLVMLVNAVGQSYFSPQSVGYLLAIGIIAIMQTRPGHRPLPPRATTAILIVVSLVLAVTHELSPYVVAGTLIALAIFKLARFWEALVTAIPAFCWAGIQHSAVGQTFSFGQLFDITNFRPPVTLATPGLERMPIVSLSSDALLLGLVILIGLAARGFLFNARRGWAWAYGLSTSAGLALVLVNPYGNEGIFRACLFAIPWLAVLAVVPRVAPTTPPRRRAGAVRERTRALFARIGHVAERAGDAVRRVGVRMGRGLPLLQGSVLTAMFVTLLGTFCLAAYGMDGSNVLRPSEVSAAQFFIKTAPAHSALLPMGSGDSPATQPQFDSKFAVINWDKVVPLALLSVAHPVQADVLWLKDEYLSWAQGYGVRSASNMYLFWTEGLALYQGEYGLQSEATAREWLQALKASNLVHLVFHQGVTYLFRFR